MKEFLEAAAIAWNPIGEARRRMRAATLTVGAVLVPYIGIIIACNLFAVGAQEFFWESLLHVAGGGELPNNALRSSYAQRLMSAIGVLVPIAAVALLPAGVFRPRGRSATVATILVVAGASAFYNAAISVPVHFVAGALNTVDVRLGEVAYKLLSIPMAIAIVGLPLFFWLRIALSVLGLRGAQIIAISLVALVAQGLVVWFYFFLG